MTASATTAESSAAPVLSPRPPKAGARARAPKARALGTTAVKGSPAGQSVDTAVLAEEVRQRRDWRLRARRWLWEHSERQRQRRCGRITHGVGGPALRVSGEGEQRRAAMAGLQSCGHMSCPWCSVKIGAERATDITTVLRYHRDAYPDRPIPLGGGAVLCTLTLRHTAAMSLLFLLGVLQLAWTRVIKGAAYRRDAATFGIVAWICALEITWSRAHWWHPHLHILILTEVPLSPELAFELGARWFERWARGLATKGLQAIMDKGGMDARPVDLSDLSTGAIADYVSKIGAEVTRADRKDGRDESFSMMGLLREVMDTYEADAVTAWWQLESTLTERKTEFVRWSKGARELRRAAGLAEKQRSAEEIAAEDLGSEDVIVIDPADWPRLRLVLEVLLRTVEQDGVQAGAVWLTEHGIGWSWATPAPRSPRPKRPPRAPRLSRPPGRANGRGKG